MIYAQLLYKDIQDLIDGNAGDQAMQFLFNYLQNENIIRGDIKQHILFKTIQITVDADDSLNSTEYVKLNPELFDQSYIKDKHQHVVINIFYQEKWHICVFNMRYKTGIIIFNNVNEFTLSDITDEMTNYF